MVGINRYLLSFPFRSFALLAYISTDDYEVFSHNFRVGIISRFYRLRYSFFITYIATRFAHFPTVVR